MKNKEREVLVLIKQKLSYDNDEQAIRVLEQYKYELTKGNNMLTEESLKELLLDSFKEGFKAASDVLSEAYEGRIKHK